MEQELCPSGQVLPAFPTTCDAHPSPRGLPPSLTLLRLPLPLRALPPPHTERFRHPHTVISNGASRRFFFYVRSCERVGLRREKSLCSFFFLPLVTLTRCLPSATRDLRRTVLEALAVCPDRAELKGETPELAAGWSRFVSFGWPILANLPIARVAAVARALGFGGADGPLLFFQATNAPV